MTAKVPGPLFHFRGHKSGVTALASSNSSLISGDEEGTIIIWNLSTFRRLKTWSRICTSKIQSLRIIKLKIDSVIRDILVTQSRDGVHLIVCDYSQVPDKPPIVDHFPTYDSLFSRGDATSIDENTAMLAYPSYLENYLVTVRYLGPDAKTLISGSANRSDSDSKKSHPNVFDIVILENPIQAQSHNLFVAYEDGCIVVYAVNPESTRKLPELNVTGLRIDVVKQFNFGISDFISAFDVKLISDNYVIVCGCPKKDIMFSSCPTDFASDEKTEKIVLKKQGSSAISIRDDLRLVAIAGWDNTVRLYSLKTKKHLATINDHLKQIHDILFVKKATENVSNSNSGNYLMYCASLDGTISVFDLY